MTIRGVGYRTFLGDQTRATQDSGVAVTFATESGSDLWYGRIQQIVEVNFGGIIKIMLMVEFFKESTENQAIKGTAWVRESRRGNSNPFRELWVEASKIDGQVFFAADPQKAGWLHVFQYKGSGYIVPAHHYDANGRMLDI